MFFRLLLVLFFLFGLVLLGWGVAYAAQTTEQTIEINPVLLSSIFFIICLIIGVVAVQAGVGGGVIFTPVMMGFTPIDSYIVRATGLLIATLGALTASRRYLRSGLANIKILFWAGVPYVVFCVVGALLAAYVKEYMGVGGEAFVRGVLGLLIIGIALIFVFAGKRVEYPEAKKVDGFTDRLGLAMAYWEESLRRVVDYRVRWALPVLALFCVVGLISGFFGLGAGWAMVPVFNLVMLTPLKVAAASSVTMIGIGDTAAIWPYILAGGIVPIYALPCMVGMIVGANIGSKMMLWVKAGFVRWILIVVMLIAGIRLILKAIELLGVA